MIKKIQVTRSDNDLATKTLEAINKINEIIDTIYDMQLAISALDPDSDWYDGQTRAENVAENGLYVTDDGELHYAYCKPVKPADPYAEQRQWIGKLCKFWDYKGEPIYGILDNVDFDDKEYPYTRLGGFVFQNCEPVKPDSEIIYHGE